MLNLIPEPVARPIGKQSESDKTTDGEAAEDKSTNDKRNILISQLGDIYGAIVYTSEVWKIMGMLSIGCLIIGWLDLMNQQLWLRGGWPLIIFPTMSIIFHTPAMIYGYLSHPELENSPLKVMLYGSPQGIVHGFIMHNIVFPIAKDSWWFSLSWMPICSLWLLFMLYSG